MSKRQKLNGPDPVWLKHKDFPLVGIPTFVFNPVSFEWVQTIFTVCDLVDAYRRHPDALLANTNSVAIEIVACSDGIETCLSPSLPISDSNGFSIETPLMVIVREAKVLFDRSTSEQQFISDHSLALEKPADSLAFLKFLFHKLVTKPLPDTASFRKNCLEHRLGKRSTEFVPEVSRDVKLLLAVSGAGKTRTILELLYGTMGYYFTVTSSQSDFGSADMRTCSNHCVLYPRPQQTKRAIHLLYAIRVAVCHHLVSLGFNSPSQILLAQLHPIEFFGIDIFDRLFDSLVHDPHFTLDIADPFSILAIDEIQVALESEHFHSLPKSNKIRPFFSPLVYYSCLTRKFPQILLSGTGINFEFVKEIMESAAMKQDQNINYKVVSDIFHPLSKAQVVHYASEYLKDNAVLDNERDEIVSQIESLELCHGRPRFVTFILDGYIGSDPRDIDSVIAQFNLVLSNPGGLLYPLRFFHDDIEAGRCSLDRVFGGETLGSKLKGGLLELMKFGDLKLNIKNPDATAAIKYGLGFGQVNPGIVSSITIKELAVIECLRYFIPFGDLVHELATQIVSAPNPQTIGYLLEYLVAYALVANHSTLENAKKIRVFKGYIDVYLNEDDPSLICFPDHLCGPDIVYKCNETKTLYVVKVKFIKTISKQERAKALDTTDPSQFYFNRKEKRPLKILVEKQSQLKSALEYMKSRGFQIKRMLFIHSTGNQQFEGEETISSATQPRFFDNIDSRLWGFLDTVRDKFNQ